MIRKFIASTADKAQGKARRALGHKVIVLNIRDLPSGDVEVTAGDENGARDYRLANPNPITPPIDASERLSPHISQPVHEETNPVPPLPVNSETPPRKNTRFSLFNRKKNQQADENNSTGNVVSHRQEPAMDDDIFTPPEHESDNDFVNSQEPDRNITSIPDNNSNHILKTLPPASGSRLHESLEQRSTENTLSNLRERLTGQKHPDLQSIDDPTLLPLINILKPHGINDRLMTMILNGARKASVEDTLYRVGLGLSESFNFSPLKSTAAIPIMLVGPTGAGKTSCAAKLAALALSEGDQAMMITTDVGRAGALEQFATYSEKLEIECYAAETPEEISTIVKEAKPQGAVILDTPGISPYDAGDLAALKSFQTAIAAEPVLVLPASGDVGEYTDWAHAFRAFGVRSCIITKFDATRRVGAGISAAFEGNMTLTYFSETPFISEGLLTASPEFLAYRLTASYPGRIVQR